MATAKKPATLTWKRDAVGYGWHIKKGNLTAKATVERYTTYQGTGEPVYQWEIRRDGYSLIKHGSEGSLADAKAAGLKALRALLAAQAK